MIHRSTFHALLLLAGAPLVACGDDAGSDDGASTEAVDSTGNADSNTVGDATVADESSTQGSADTTAGETGVETSPAIVLAERVFLPEGRVYYVSVVDEVPTGPVDRSLAREFSSADVEVYEGGVYIRDRDSNVITRFTVSEERELVEDVAFSFQNTGLGNGRIYNAYVSPTRAFALDSAGWRLVEWNPTEMVLTGEEVALTGYAKDGLPDGSMSKPVRVGDRLISQVSWNDYATLTTHPGIGAALVIDDLGAPTLVEDDRVAGGYAIYGDADGNAYLPGILGGDIALFGSAAGGGELPPSGVLRIPAGETTFDSDYFVDVSAISGTPGGVWAIHRIDDTHLLVQLWDPETPTDGITTVDEYYEAPEFIYGIVDTEAETFTAIDSIPRGTVGNSLDHRVDGVIYVQTSVDLGGDMFEASVHRVTATGTEEAFTVPSGDLWHLERVR